MRTDPEEPQHLEVKKMRTIPQKQMKANSLPSRRKTMRVEYPGSHMKSFKKEITCTEATKS